MKHTWKKWISLILALCLVTGIAGAFAEEPAVKKITADVKEVLLYTNQTEPVTVQLAAAPEGASLQGLTVAFKKEGIATCEPGENGTLRFLPVSEGKTSANVTCGKAKLSLPVRVVKPVTGLSLSYKGTPEPGKKITLSAAIEPKNAANKQVEWAIENAEAGSIDPKGNLTISKDAAPGSSITVTCKALGTGEPVEARMEITVALKMSKEDANALAIIRDMPVPVNLRKVGPTAADWASFRLPEEMAKITGIQLNGNKLTITLDRKVYAISTGEISQSEMSYYGGDYVNNVDSITWTLTDTEKNKYLADIIEDRTKEFERESTGHFYVTQRFAVNPAGGTATPVSSNMSGSFKPDIKKMLPGTRTKYLSAEEDIQFRADGSVERIFCSYMEFSKYSMEYDAEFDKEGKLVNCSVMRQIEEKGGEPLNAQLSFGADGKARFFYLFAPTFEFGIERHDMNSVTRSTIQRKYEQADLNEEGLQVWEFRLNQYGTRYETILFATREDIYTHGEDGSVTFNTEAKDLNGDPMPMKLLISEWFNENSFAYPNV